MGPGRLGPDERAGALAALAGRELDMLVVGGGVVGAGTALDAVTRGLDVGLVDMRDWGGGTSSRSSKLIHGGLRYLEMLDFGLVREALSERSLLLTELAPHLVRPVPFLYPLTHHGWERAYVGAGIALYDTLAAVAPGRTGVPRHRHLTRRQVRRLMPALRPGSYVGAVQYWDAQVDDARFVVNLVRTAAAYGAHCASRVRVIGFLREGERVVGAKVRNTESGEEWKVRARQVVNATGVWTDDTQALVGERGQFHVKASKGVHLVVPRDRIHASMGLIARTENSVLFVIPWKRHWIVGTTDTQWDLDKAHPAASRVDIDYLLSQANKWLATPLARADVQGVYAGLRPLLAGESENTSALSREHVVAHPVPGLVVVAGGKYTTYRVMARDAVDAAVHAMNERVPPSCTERIPLIGGAGYQAAWNSRERTAATTGLHVARIEHLLRRYGADLQPVLDLAASDPMLREPVGGAEDYLCAEIVHAAAWEGARHLDDVMTRRTRISVETFDRGMSATIECADLMAGVLGWTVEQTANEIEHYVARVAAERESQDQPDDRTADAARMGAPDIVPVR
ncbi:MAG TPA: glycerol-3-phosphate dehydrogenase/oxidase [Sporichthyaceae bacterium]|nr:glycerol-3-phosphate dehydrogenase/oxidase [Sporichthyaceae bacterium]